MSASSIQREAKGRQSLIVAIAGCSGSGKTTLARELAQQLGATLFPLDLYYRDLGHLPLEERARQNFDAPESLEEELIAEHLQTLAEGRAIRRPVYDFRSHTRVMEQSELVVSGATVIVEGILALHFTKLLPLYDFNIFVNATREVCLRRRIHRDVVERGRTEESVRAQFAETAWPMALQYVLPSAARASLIVEGTESLDWSVEQVRRRLHEAGLA